MHIETVRTTPRFAGAGMQIETIRITPKLAEKFLNENTNNRHLRSGLVEKYARDMANGRWTDCPEPISFYEDGTLADGQHRLWAIIESGTTQTFFVVRGVSRAAALNINTGASRSFVDNASLAGMNASSDIAATARMVEWGTPQVKPTPSYTVLARALEKHGEAAAFAVHRIKGRGLKNGSICGAVARAWYVEPDKERLARFCAVVSSGFSAGDYESAAVAIRNAALANAMAGIGSCDARVDLFLKAQNAVRYFMRGKKLTVIKTIKDEAYPRVGRP